MLRLPRDHGKACSLSSRPMHLTPYTACLSLIARVPLIVLILFIPGASQGVDQNVQSRGLTYTNTEWGYSVSLPQGWEQIPREVIDSYGEALQAQTGEPSASVSVAFQMKGRSPFSYPYVGIEHMAGEPFTLDEIEQPETIAALNALAAQTSGKGMYKSFAFENPEARADLNCMLVDIVGELTNGSQIRGLLALVPCRWGVVGVYCYSFADDYHLNRPRFVDMLHSLSFAGSTKTGATRSRPPVGSLTRQAKESRMPSSTQVLGWVGLLIGSSVLLFGLSRLFLLIAKKVRRQAMKGVGWAYVTATAVACVVSFLPSNSTRMWLGYCVSGLLVYLIECAIRRHAHSRLVPSETSEPGETL